MKREFLENLGIDAEAVNKIMNENGKDINASKAKAQEAETKLKEKDEAIKSLKEQIKERDSQLENLSKQVEDNPDLQKQIDDLKKQNEKTVADYEEKLKTQSIKNQIENALIKSKAKNVRTVQPLIDEEQLMLDKAGKLIGLDEQIEKIKKENDYLFGDEKPVGNLPPDGLNANGGEKSFSQKLAESANETNDGGLNFD